VPLDEGRATSIRDFRSPFPTSRLFDPRDALAQARTTPVSLTRFIGSDLVAALGRLESGSVLGPWRQRRPADRRQKMKFTPVLYGEDHHHDHAELCLLLEGRCRFSFEHRGCVLRPGDLVVCPAGVPHAEAYLRPGEGYRLAWWSLSRSDPRLHSTRYSRRGGFAIEHLMALDLLPAAVQERLEILRRLAGGRAAPDVDRLREAMLTVALALYRSVLDCGEAKLDSRAQLVRRAADFVRAGAHRPLSLAEVACAVHVSPNYLTGLFRKVTGVSLGRFILGERIVRAQQLLAAPDASVKTVALGLGFADPFTFSRAFKRVTGRSPLAWRGARA
jgi:AraC-like DNA-binding protein/mannose-6-phosphate isomerase-like protein (cupin superfamily)